ncbi:MAG: ankyrin repeat domain-containing protein [Clostridiaceae bacterium]|nr:ankyrin repeat domain-containing protein [Clostridiaceae bacterium]
MSSRFFYYATDSYLRKILLEIESAVEIQYVKTTSFYEKGEPITKYNSISDFKLPGSEANGSTRSLHLDIFRRDRALFFFGRESYKGKLTYKLYEPNGHNSVFWVYGGEYEGKSVFYGNFTIYEESPEAEELYRIIKNTFYRNCARDRGYYISPDLFYRKDEFKFNIGDYPTFSFIPSEKSAKITQKLKKAFYVEQEPDFWSFEYDDYENACKTLDSISNINKQDKNGMTYLMHAIQGENFDIAQKLLEKGADPNIPDNRGLTPLSYLIYFDEDFFQMLIDYGANIDLQVNDRFTIRDYLQRFHSEEYKKFLELPLTPQKVIIKESNKSNRPKAENAKSSDDDTTNLKEQKVMIENHKKSKTYMFKNNWSIEFPTDWSYETDETDGHNIFYPPDSELTIRISEFFTNAKEDDLKRIYKESVPADSKKYELGFGFNSFSSLAYETVEYQHDIKVYRFIIGCYKDGLLLSINIYALKRDECIQALKYIKTIKSNDEPPKRRLSLLDRLRR